MKSKKLFRPVLLAIALGVASATGAIAHDLVWPGEKLEAMYPEATSFDQKNLYVSDEQKVRIQATLGRTLPEEDLKPSIYLVIVKATPEARARRVAALMFIDAWGRGGKIEMGVGINGKGTVSNVRVFENKEEAPLDGSPFLDQLQGKTKSDAFQVGADLQTMGVDKKTATAIAEGTRRGVVIINEMFRRK